MPGEHALSRRVERLRFGANAVLERLEDIKGQEKYHRAFYIVHWNIIKTVMAADPIPLEARLLRLSWSDTNHVSVALLVQA